MVDSRRLNWLSGRSQSGGDADGATHTRDVETGAGQSRAESSCVGAQRVTHSPLWFAGQERVVTQRDGGPSPQASQILGLAPFGVVTLDLRGHITTANPAAARLFGHDEPDLRGRHVTLLLPGFVPELGDDKRTIGRHRRGHEFPVAMSFSPLGVEANRDSVIFLRELDPSQPRETDAAEEDDMLDIVVQSIAGFTWTADPHGNVEYASPGMREYLGRSMESLKNAGWIDALHPEDADRIVAAWARTVHSGERQDTEVRLRSADDSYRWFRVCGLPSRDRGGFVRRWCGVAYDIEDRKQVEDRLQKSEKSLRVMVDAIPGMLCVTSAQGEVEYVNRPTLDAIGADLEIFRNFGWKSVIHPEDADGLAQRWMAAIETGELMEAEYRQQQADGSYRWWQTRVKPFKDEAGTILRWYGVMTDVDERKTAERALRLSEEKLRGMVDGVPGMLCLCGPDGELEYVNQPMRELIGHDLEESKRMGWTSTIHADDRQQLAQRWLAATKTHQVLDHEYRRLCPDGSYRWFHVRMKPQFDAQGQPSRWYALITDVDARVQAEQAQRSSEQQLRKITDLIPVMVWCADPSGQLSYVNHQVLDFFGVSLKELQRDPYHRIHPADREAARHAWSSSIENRSRLVARQRVCRADGVYRWHEVRADPAYAEDGRLIQWYAVQFDIDDGKRMEEALHSTQYRLARASQLATVAELSASIAHEINQPLAAVVTNGHACERWLAANPPNIAKAQLAASRVVRDASSAAEVISRIRALFKRTAIAKIPVDINQLIVEVCELMASERRKGDIALETRLAPDLPLTLADPIQIQQVVANLVRNSCDAMGSSSEPQRKLLVRSSLEGEGVVVDICDEGHGLVDVELAFEPFFTTKREGMGIGLSVCRSIIHGHGGRLWATKNATQGMTFTFSLPVDQGNAA